MESKSASNSAYCEKISKQEYEKQSKDYTMRQLKELQSQLHNFKPKPLSNTLEDSDSDSEIENDLENDLDNDENVNTGVTININKNKKSKNSKMTEKEKDSIISNLIIKKDLDNRRMNFYSNKIKELKKQQNDTEQRLHYLKLDINNLTIENDSLKKELKEKSEKIDKFCEHFQRKKIEMFLLKFIICVLFFSNLYTFFS